MTNDEAITKLTNIMHDDHYSWHPAILTAFNMAVDALKGAEGDWISRAEAIDVLDDGAELLRRVLDDMDVVGAEREKYEWGLGLIESYISDMKELPSAQPERKCGRWEMLQIPISPPVYKCSVCGSHALQTLTGCLVNRHYESNLTKFCPNCGADMREGENDA